jgi:excisionase family DNA binding protein
MEAAAQRALALRTALQGRPLMDIVRFRPRGQADRRIKVEYLADQEHPGSVLMRLTPLSSAELPPEPLLSTQQAADRLGVSRPYVLKLVEKNTCQGVIRTASGHRRIPAAVVDRVRTEMSHTRRQALVILESETSDLRQRELEEARGSDATRWVRTAR